MLDDDLVEAIRALVESNLPYLTRIRFDAWGGHWESLVTAETHPEAMVWRLRSMENIATRLRSSSGF